MGDFKIIKHVTYTYETSDGNIFEHKQDAMAWQEHLFQIEKLRMLDCDFEPTRDMNLAIYVFAETQEQAEAFNAVQKELGVCVAINGPGYYYYDDISGNYSDIEYEIKNLQHMLDMLKAGGIE